MEMSSRYGTHSTRIISLTRAFDFPLRNIGEGDRVAVLTDDAMDPLVWQSLMGSLVARGADPVLALYARRDFHCADPPPLALEMARDAHLIVALTTTALNSGTAGLAKIRSVGGTGKTPVWLLEEMTQEILLDGGGRAKEADIKEICELQGRIGAIYDRGNRIKVTSKSGTDLEAEIDGYPPNYHADRWSKLPFERNSETGRVSGGTWPFGEVHVEPKPGTANGVVVWDQTAHIPPGQWHGQVRLEIRDGRVVSIKGGAEARAVIDYIEKYGDDKALEVGGEIALGTNKFCLPLTGSMRSEKKRYGAMHFGIGTGPDRGIVKSNLRLEGITDAVTIRIDDELVSDDGEIVV